MTQRLSEQVVLVTGGAGAIGQAIGEAVLAEGGRAVLLDLDADATATAAAALDPAKASCIGASCDVTQMDEAERAVSLAVKHFGRVDGLVNNAGIVQLDAAVDTTPEQWQRHFEVNVSGAFAMSKAAASHFRSAGGGVVVNVASNCGKVGYRNMAAYNASKAAMISMTRSLAQEWADDGINVNAVCPGGVDTAMLAGVAEWLSPRLGEPADELLAGMGAEQLGRRIQPIEVARVITFLLCDDARIIRGQAINVDGGDTPY